MYKKYLVLALLLIVGLYCKKDELASFSGFKKPLNFPEPVYNFSTNTVTKDGFLLGRTLFYDERLSRNNTISCGSCHIQSSAFTHHGHDVSHGIDDLLGTRNAPAIQNLAWYPTYMWDGGIFDLDLQPIAPITNHVEMDETLENVLNKLRSSSTYPNLFKKAYGSTEINSARFLKALSQFMAMCVSANSKYDKVKRGEAGLSFTAEEQAGYSTFVQKCAGCHPEPLFSDFTFRNNGLAIGANNDQGRFMITSLDQDQYKFKVPSLRNVELTAPYMHDGRFYSLSAVLDHYSSNVTNTPNLDPLLNAGGTLGILMTDTDKSNIIAFLKTLTDRDFISNKLLSQQ